MKFNDFVTSLYDAGWLGTGDAQHTEIKKLWRAIFPVVADLEDEVQELKEEIEEYVDAQPPI